MSNIKLTSESKNLEVSAVRLYNSNNNLTLDASGNYNLQFKTNGTNRLTITDSSSVFLNNIDLSGNNLNNVNTINSKINVPLNLTSSVVSGSGNYTQIYLNAPNGIVQIGDDGSGTGNGNYLQVFDGNNQIVGDAGLVSIGDYNSRFNGVSLDIYNNGASSYFKVYTNVITRYNIDFSGNHTWYSNNTSTSPNLTFSSSTGLLGFGRPKYSVQYIAGAFSITDTTPYSTTSDGSGTLPVVNATNVGIQYLFTSVSGGLVISSSSSQLIYSTIAPASATSRTLAAGNSHIFTAIRVGTGTSSTNFAWSMV